MFAFAAMVWTTLIVAFPQYFSLPILLFMIPLFGFFAVKALFGPLLYLRRVPCTKGEVLGAALAGMALSHSIALGVFAASSRRTRCSRSRRRARRRRPAPAEPLRRAGSPGARGVRDAAGLAACFAAMAIWRKGNHMESAMWLSILVLQAVPYIAALVCHGLSKLPERAEGAASAARRRCRPT